MVGRTVTEPWVINRRGFFERAELEVVRSRRNGRPFCLLLADLDNFKMINDTLGHIAGDHCLKRVAEVMSANLRPTDLIARYGGEELILLLPETTEELALKLAERLRLAVAEMDGRQITVTISIGVAASHADKNLDALIAEVDRALYAAKHAGKNQVSTLSQV
jgi:diguanylate cyclase (GGDEF)-like protein